MVGGSTPCTAGDTRGEGLLEGLHWQLVTTGGDKCQQVSTADSARGHVTPRAVSPLWSAMIASPRHAWVNAPHTIRRTCDATLDTRPPEERQ